MNESLSPTDYEKWTLESALKKVRDLRAATDLPKAINFYDTIEECMMALQAALDGQTAYSLQLELLTRRIDLLESVLFYKFKDIGTELGTRNGKPPV